MVARGECFTKRIAAAYLVATKHSPVPRILQGAFSTLLLLEIESILSALSVPAASVSRCGHEYMRIRVNAQLPLSAAKWAHSHCRNAIL
jgi:hypothetical protein